MKRERETPIETAEKRLLYLVTQIDYILKELPSMNYQQLILVNHDLTTIIARLEAIEMELEGEKNGLF